MRTCSVVLGCLLMACASTPEKGADAPDPADHPAAPDAGTAAATAPEAGKPAATVDIPALIARETQPAPLLDFKAPGGIFEGRAEATAAPTFSSEGEGMTAIVIPVGTESAVTCFTYENRIDPAGALAQVVASVAEAVQVKAVAPTDVITVAEAPVMFLRMEYLADVPGGKAFGQLKLAVSARPDLSFMCMHDEAGYHASFRRWVETFGQHLRSNEETAAAPRFREIQVVRLNGQPIGFAERSVFAKKDGRFSETYNSMVLPRSATELVTSDSYSGEAVDPSGLLKSVVYVKSLNAEKSAELRLTREAKGYAYAGTWEGKALSGNFKSDQPLAGDVRHWRLVDELLQSKKQSLQVPSYSPSTDPTVPTVVTYRPDPATPRGVQVELGPMKFGAVVDEHGVIERSEVPMGRITIVTERLFSSGAP